MEWVNEQSEMTKSRYAESESFAITYQQLLDEYQSNDRIPYVYIETKDKPKLQGDRIETPEYIKEMSLKPDYMFYITNQIMKRAD